MWSRIERSKNPFVHVRHKWQVFPIQSESGGNFRDLTWLGTTPPHYRRLAATAFNSTAMSSDYEYSDDEGDYYDEDDVMNVDDEGESTHDKE